MHIGLLLLSWVLGVGALQLLPTSGLLAALAACLLAAGMLAPRRCWRLLRRVRILLLAIAILFLGFTPGEAILQDWPSLSPTREGAVLAFEHAARLVAVVCCVAILLERVPSDRLVSGLYAVCSPFRWLRLSPERLAVRLLLVLRYAESPPPGGWRAWMGEDEAKDDEPLRLVRERLGLVDALVLALLVGALLSIGWRAG